MRKMKHCHFGFTVVEAIVCILAAGVLLVSTVAMTQGTRDDAMVVASTANLRNLATATAIYAAEWNDRQFTLVADDLAEFGRTMEEALANYAGKRSKPHPSIALGERTNSAGKRVRSALDVSVAVNQRWLQPISFDARPVGSFRAINVRGFNEYVDGRFYGRTFFAPKDTAAMKVAAPGFRAELDESPSGDGDLYWSSYSRSAAAMYDPQVLKLPHAPSLPRGPLEPGFNDPFSFARGFRSPAWSQTLYPHLKTNLIEHHWLQNRPVWAADCNAAIEGGTYDGCEPHYFNHYAYSEPACLFADGHVALVKVADVLDADRRVRDQSGHGLWFRRPGGAADGYFESMAADPTRTSFHLFTADGIRGRDVIR